MTEINSYVFSGNDTIYGVQLPSSITSIGDGAFSNCDNLESITIPENVREIGYGTLFGCTGLTSVTLNASIGSDFGNFLPSSVKTIHIGKNVKSFATNLFSDLSNLTDITADSENNYYSSLNGNLYNKEQTALIKYAPGKTAASFEIPDTVTSIGNSAFQGCTKLAGITLPEGVTSIGNSAFQGCTGLAGITLPEGITSIGNSAFQGCTGLADITLPEGLTKIDHSVFSGCTSLTSITIPQGVTSIGDYAFYYCDGLTSVTIPEGVTTIDYEAFYCCTGLTKVTLPESLTTLGNRAFYNCKELTSITIPENIASISYEAFSCCTKLTSVNWNAVNAPQCSNDIFYRTAVNTIHIGKNVKAINGYMLSSLDKLTSITVDEENDYFSSVDGNLYKEQTELVKYLPKASETRFAIPRGVTSIGAYAFYKCSGLTEVIIPEGVTAIGGYAFFSCTGLTDITIPEGLTTIGADAFYGCTGLTGITIPESVTLIGNSAFSGCENLRNVTFAEAASSEKTVTVGDYAFYGCTSLSSINLPENAAASDERAYSIFSGCSRLKNITLPNGITYLGIGAFSECTALETITLPESLERIEHDWIDYGNNHGVFTDCTSLKAIYYPGTNDIVSDSGGVSCRDLIKCKHYYYFDSGLGTPVETIHDYCVEYAPESYRDDLVLVGWRDTPWGADIISFPYYGYEMGSYTAPTSYTLYALWGAEARFYGDYCGSLVTLVGMEFWQYYLPTPPEGYIYEFTVDGEKWDYTQAAYKNVDVNVKKVPIQYTVTFTGDYEGTEIVNHAADCNLPEPPVGYTYSFTTDGKPWDGTNITAGVTVTVEMKVKICTVTYIGDSTETISVEYGKSVELPAEDGYRYTFTANGEAWTGENITEDVTVTVKKVKLYTVTFVGDYDKKITVEYGDDVELPSEIGYTYTFTVNGEEWNGKNISADVIVNTVKEITYYTITYTGEYSKIDFVVYGGNAVLPTPPTGYTYSFTANGKPWDGTNITSSVTVEVAKKINTYTITFTGEYENVINVTHGESVSLPEPPVGYTYSFTADGKPWDGTNIISSAVVNVEKQIITYRVTYLGEYQDTVEVAYGEAVVLPTPPEGYAYIFTADDEPWDGKNIKSDKIVLVTSLCDRCDIVAIGDCYDPVNDGKLTASTYFGTIDCGKIAVSEGASARVYADETFSGDTLSTAASDGSTVFITVTAESGRSVTYAAKFTHTPVADLGEIEFKYAEDGYVILRLKNEAPGEPKIFAAYSKNGVDYTYAEADCSHGTLTFPISDPEVETQYFVKAAADYRSGEYVYSDVIEIVIDKTASNECEITRIVSPSIYSYDENTKTITAKVANRFTEYPISVEVSAGATWGLYLSKNASLQLDANKLPLTEGKYKTAYIKVLAEDGITKNVYTVKIYRQKKSAVPEITVSSGNVMITVPEESVVWYTTDNRTPVPDVCGKLYTGAFPAEPGTVVKAIALNYGFEEYSDVAAIVVSSGEKAEIELMEMSVENSLITFEYYLMTKDSSCLNGSFYFAAYGENGQLLNVFGTPVAKSVSEGVMSGSLAVSEAPAYVKAFFWGGESGIEPLSKALPTTVGE